MVVAISIPSGFSVLARRILANGVIADFLGIERSKFVSASLSSVHMTSPFASALTKSGLPSPKNLW